MSSRGMFRGMGERVDSSLAGITGRLSAADEAVRAAFERAELSAAERNQKAFIDRMMNVGVRNTGKDAPTKDQLDEAIHLINDRVWPATRDQWDDLTEVGEELGLGVGNIDRIMKSGNRDAIKQLLETAQQTYKPGPIESFAARGAESSRQGMVTRGAVVGGGTVAGLTAAGQGLVALMEFLNSGQEQQIEREQVLQ